MRTNNNIIEYIISILTNIDFNKAKDITKEKDKEALFNYINKEFLDLDEYKYLLSVIELSKEDILEILYQLLTVTLNNDKEIYKDNFNKTKTLIKQASKYGFTWPNSDSCFKKVEEEFVELKNAIKDNNATHIKEELGDLLFTLLCYVDMKNYNIVEILNNSNNKFEKRFNKLKEIAKLEKINLLNLSSEEKEKLWKKAKKKVNLP